MLMYMKDLIEDKSGKITNFVQGELFKQYRNNFKNKKVTVPIRVTFDDYEPNNVIGSHAGDQKLCSGYFNFLCLLPK
uniref:Uncharacterized protein n=1 Tax=Trichogramma kaykai TaxID=54128 RepID=A0ABD2X758_9HYME